MLPNILLQCRPGFENEAAAEISEWAAQQQVAGYARAQPQDGFLLFVLTQPSDAAELIQRLPFAQLIFVRQWFLTGPLLTDLPTGDRVAPLLRRIQAEPGTLHGLFLETPDTNEGKALSPLLRGIATPLQDALAQRQLFGDKSQWRVHIFFTGSHEAYVGYAPVDNSSPWPMGIPRLRFPRSAPSRSMLKLEEAFHTFLTERQRQRLLQPGAKAVDLGAAPGGWTWYLVKHGCFVTAVDNGPMNIELLETGQVEHLRADGFRYRPNKPVTWMVCDMVEQPRKIAALVAEWFVNGFCQYSIFNLKLPMKKRYAEVLLCRDLILDSLEKANVKANFRCKQLYHDREEVTCFLSRS